MEVLTKSSEPCRSMKYLRHDSMKILVRLLIIGLVLSSVLFCSVLNNLASASSRVVPCDAV